MENQIDINNVDVDINDETVSMLLDLSSTCKSSFRQTITSLAFINTNDSKKNEFIGLNEAVNSSVPLLLHDNIKSDINEELKFKSYYEYINLFKSKEDNNINLLKDLTKAEFAKVLVDNCEDDDINNFEDLLFNNVDNILNQLSTSLGKRGRNYLDQWEDEDFLHRSKQESKLKPLVNWNELFRNYNENTDSSYREWLIYNSTKYRSKSKDKNKLIDSQHSILAPPVPSAIHHPACWGINSRTLDKHTNCDINSTLFETIHPASYSTKVVDPPAKQLNISDEYEDDDEIYRLTNHMTKEMELLETFTYIKLQKINNNLNATRFINKIKDRRQKIATALNNVYLANEPKTSERYTYLFKPLNNATLNNVTVTPVRYSTRGKLTSADSASKRDHQYKEAPLIGSCVQSSIVHNDFILKMKIGDCIECFFDLKWTVALVTHLRYDNLQLLRFVKVKPLSSTVLSSIWIAVEDNLIAPLYTYVSAKSNKKLQQQINEAKSNENTMTSLSNTNNYINPTIYDFKRKKSINDCIDSAINNNNSNNTVETNTDKNGNSDIISAKDKEKRSSNVYILPRRQLNNKTNGKVKVKLININSSNSRSDYDVNEVNTSSSINASADPSEILPNDNEITYRIDSESLSDAVIDVNKTVNTHNSNSFGFKNSIEKLQLMKNLVTLKSNLTSSSTHTTESSLNDSNSYNINNIVNSQISYTNNSNISNISSNNASNYLHNNFNTLENNSTRSINYMCNNHIDDKVNDSINNRAVSYNNSTKSKFDINFNQNHSSLPKVLALLTNKHNNIIYDTSSQISNYNISNPFVINPPASCSMIWPPIINVDNNHIVHNGNDHPNIYNNYSQSIPTGINGCYNNNKLDR